MAAITSPCSYLLNRLPVRPLLPLTSNPVPAVNANAFGLSGDSLAILASFQSPVGARHPSRERPSLTMILVLAGGRGGANCARAWLITNRLANKSIPLLDKHSSSYVLSNKHMAASRTGLYRAGRWVAKLFPPSPTIYGIARTAIRTTLGIEIADIFIIIGLQRSHQKIVLLQPRPVMGQKNRFFMTKYCMGGAL